eukprot:COSAG01_NODE_14720_length_1418_cov_3.245641_3_plen_55_part_01
MAKNRPNAVAQRRALAESWLTAAWLLLLLLRLLICWSAADPLTYSGAGPVPSEWG